MSLVAVVIAVVVAELVFASLASTDVWTMFRGRPSHSPFVLVWAWWVGAVVRKAARTDG
jgi:hypothetical protein